MQESSQLQFKICFCFKGYREFLVFIFTTLSSISLFSQSINVIACEDNIPIENVYLVKDKNQLEGISNEKGEISYQSHLEGSRIGLQKLGFKDTLIVLENNNSYCLATEYISLPPVEINLNYISVEEQLDKFVKKASSKMLSYLDTLYYAFEMTVKVPDSSWEENRRGVVRVVYNPYSKKYDGTGGSHYCELSINIDSSFWLSPNLNNYVRHRTLSFIGSDLMRKGHFPLKKLKNTTIISRSFDSMYPTFEIESGTRKSKDRSYRNLIFYPDSNLKSSEYLWINEDNIMLQAKAIDDWSFYQKYRYWSFTEGVNAVQDSVFIKESYFTSKGAFQINTFSMRLTPSYQDCGSCIQKSIFLKLSPENLEKNGISVKHKKQ